MATLTFYRTTEPELAGELLIGAVTSSHFTLIAGTLQLTFHGNFGYSDQGVSGTLTAMDLRDVGGIYFDITGLFHDIERYFELLLTDAEGAERYLLSGNDSIHGSPGDESLNAFWGADAVFGGGGNDTLFGSGMDDQADWHPDTLSGGTGDDLYFPMAGDVIIEAPAEGWDRVFVSDTAGWWPAYVLAENFEEAELGVTGTLRGNAGANRLICGPGPDTLEGGGGPDTLEGGDGDDTYWLVETIDTIIDSGGFDTARIETQHYDALFPAVERIELVAAGSIWARGDAGNNDLRVVSGFAGDWLEGLGGDDTLDGGAGNDTLVGGSGDDTYRVDSSKDVAIEAAGDGRDTVVVRSSSYDDAYQLPANVEDLVLGSGPGGIGNDLDNRMTSLWGGRLDGGAGADTLTGGFGADTFVVDNPFDVIVEPPTAADFPDTVESSISFDLTGIERVENLWLTGNADLTGRGNDLVNWLRGNSGANVLVAVGSGDSLSGEDGDDTLLGDSGNDTLDGGAGSDSMVGGAGNDFYRLDSAGDIAVEGPGGGIDEILVRGSATLPEHFERMTVLSDGAPVSVSGTASGAEWIRFTGSGGATMHGGGGSGDTLIGSWDSGDVLYDDGAPAMLAGSDGNDTYYVTNAATRVADNDQGTVFASLDFALGRGPATLVLTAGTTATGNSRDNHLTGNAAANLLHGLAGDDTLVGGDGDDTLDGDAGFDSALYAGPKDSYTVTKSGGVVTVAGPDGIDHLIGVDRLEFSDGEQMLNANLAVGTRMAVTGAAYVGHAVTARLAVTDADGAGPLNYQWFRERTVTGDGATWSTGPVPIAGATSASYVLQAEDALPGTSVTVRARFTDGQCNTESLWLSLWGQIGPADSTDLWGSLGDDRIDGTPAAERMAGLNGNDTLDGGGGSDTIAGGDGVDTVDFGVPLSGLLLVSIGSSIEVRTTRGELSLYDIERAAFDDALFGVDTDQGGNIYLANALLWAWNATPPTTAELSRTVRDADDNSGYHEWKWSQLAAEVLDHYAPGITTQALVQHLFRNLAHMTPTDAQVEAFASQVGLGKTWTANADLFAYAAQHDLNTVNFIGFAGSIVPLDPAYF